MNQSNRIPHPILFVHIMGGLGNQLFQIFAGLAYCMKNAAYSCRFPAKNTSSNRPTYWHNFLKPLQGYVQNGDEDIRDYYQETHFHYKAIARVNNQPSFLLHGYFQSPRYFEEYKETIFQILQIREQQGRVAADAAFAVATPNERNICMHFRIGDYRWYPQHHPILPVTYYRNGLKHYVDGGSGGGEGGPIGPLSTTVHYFCEKGDRKYVEKEYIEPLKKDFPTFSFVVGCPRDMPDWEEMLYMSLFQHFIIANSTFSWWAAYLSREGSHVYYPSVWFGDALQKHDTRDLFPHHWQCVPCK